MYTGALRERVSTKTPGPRQTIIKRAGDETQTYRYNEAEITIDFSNKKADRVADKLSADLVPVENGASLALRNARCVNRGVQRRMMTRVKGMMKALEYNTNKIESEQKDLLEDFLTKYPQMEKRVAFMFRDKSGTMRRLGLPRGLTRDKLVYVRNLGTKDSPEKEPVPLEYELVYTKTKKDKVREEQGSSDKEIKPFLPAVKNGNNQMFTGNGALQGIGASHPVKTAKKSRKKQTSPDLTLVSKSLPSIPEEKGAQGKDDSCKNTSQSADDSEVNARELQMKRVVPAFKVSNFVLTDFGFHPPRTDPYIHPNFKSKEDVEREIEHAAQRHIYASQIPSQSYRGGKTERNVNSLRKTITGRVATLDPALGSGLVGNGQNSNPVKLTVPNNQYVMKKTKPKPLPPIESKRHGAVMFQLGSSKAAHMEGFKPL
ncbi:uncharacterized protein LOC106172036 [Lingula anatina]|uniref:Uncharacterized protein LOC106172036 n=1 Tax=Lingula anatina TaxID=7574 RepID=A0A1S3JCL4_LINAN|nr:uncharacterized protein LOC106172036 [Lingula anatina]|eukprot:XP_013408068.1 uncharacterized protein LOC106172036 [Lingula anatina]